jgi:hypothetical protein
VHVEPARGLKSHYVIAVLANLGLVHGVPEHSRSDQGSAFIATAVEDWIAAIDVTTTFTCYRRVGRHVLGRTVYLIADPS